jgi:hypothetical protein
MRKTMKAVRLHALANACADLRTRLSATAGGPEVLAAVEKTLRQHAASLDQYLDPPGSPAATASPPPSG